jgi:hypothetical protein
MKYKLLLVILLILSVNCFTYGGDASVGTSIYQELQQAQLLNNNSNGNGFSDSVSYYVKTKKPEQASESNSQPKKQLVFNNKIGLRSISKSNSYSNKKIRSRISFQQAAKKLQTSSKKNSSRKISNNVMGV